MSLRLKLINKIFVLFFVTEIPPQKVTAFRTLCLGIEWDILNIKAVLTSRHDSVAYVIEI